MKPICLTDADAPPRPADGDGFDLTTITCCPRCRAPVWPAPDLWRCSAPDCAYAAAGFPIVAGQPVLVDFSTSIFQRSNYERGTGSVLPRDDSGRGFRTRLRRLVLGHNEVAPRMCQIILGLARQSAVRPCILVIGGGAIGSGMDRLYREPGISVIGTDVYASPSTRLVADGHALPFRDGVFDVVVIQAVLEHVLAPNRVVAEIHRVLRPDGLVYADTPFMQQVHEGAYDFTRFTRGGHRWLFRDFGEIEAGSVGGAGTSLLWSIRYFARALGAGNRMSLMIAAAFAWLRPLERLGAARANADAASGHYFLGRRAATPVLRETDMIAYYESQARQPGPAPPT